ncbi:MAG: ABC transporter ATP-binding protein [Planctomycetes bacterium]|nr:ABC transporter ATP-binding protein [Planctomycetota bacterium]
MSALLEVRGLALVFDTPHGPLPVLERLDLTLSSGETLALVGESGCGKTLLALAVIGCLPAGARVVGGEIRFRGRDLLSLAPAERRALCGRELALSFQEPASALNPLLTIGEQIAEGLRLHAGLSKKAAWARAEDLLSEVGLEVRAGYARRYPHELSGGQRQRAMLSIALACGPSLLIADEPTSALDLCAQAELLTLLAALRARREMALLLITHDLAVVAELATRVAVMYAGAVVEEGGVLELFEHAAHPYTQGLLRSRGTAALARSASSTELDAGRAALPANLPAIPGQVPVLGRWPGGCRFHPRCARADERCTRESPQLLPAPPSARAPAPRAAPDATPEVCAQRAACHHAGEERP